MSVAVEMAKSFMSRAQHIDRFSARIGFGRRYSKLIREVMDWQAQRILEILEAGIELAEGRGKSRESLELSREIAMALRLIVKDEEESPK
ncbi:MAG: hypothetical protein V3U22_03045 [Vicinamibacteria bacterium]